MLNASAHHGQKHGATAKKETEQGTEEQPNQRTEPVGRPDPRDNVRHNPKSQGSLKPKEIMPLWR